MDDMQNAEIQSPDKQKSLIQSFFLVCMFYFVIQCLVFTAFALSFGFFASYAPLFFPINFVLHAFLLAVLVLFRHDFRKEPSGEILIRINLANIITLFRLSVLPTVYAILHASKDYPIGKASIVLVILVFSSDFLDGYVSRKGKQVTRAGKMLDASSDYALLLVVGLLFQYFHFIPLWFFAMLMVRLFGQGIMAGLILACGRKLNPSSSLFGKIAVASTMVMFTVEVTRFFLNLPSIIYLVLESATALILAISLVEKFLLMLLTLRTPILADKGKGRLHGTPEPSKPVQGN